MREARHRRRGDRRRQRQHRRLAGRSPRALARGSSPVAARGLRQRADGRHRRRARHVRHHGRRRRQLRLPRDPEVRRASCARATTSCRAAGCRRAAARCMPGAMPFLHRWLGNPMFSVLARRVVPRADPRRLLRHARLHASELYERLDQRCTGMEFATEMIIKASLFGGAHRRGADHAAPGRPQGPPAAPEDVPRRLADAAVLPDVQPALAVPRARASADRCSGLLGYALALPGRRPRRRHVRRPHAAVRQPGDPVRLSGGPRSRSSPRRSPSPKG